VQIGIISDTHGYLDEQIISHLQDCQEIWHAGDMGSVAVIDKLSALAKTKMVYGNIDGHEIRNICPEYQYFKAGGLSVYMIHIGGYPGKYRPQVRQFIAQNRPGLFISGHSHILKIIPDNKYGLLHINPGAAGRIGFHKIRTLIKLQIEYGKISDLKVIELGKRSAL